MSTDSSVGELGSQCSHLQYLKREAEDLALAFGVLVVGLSFNDPAWALRFGGIFVKVGYSLSVLSGGNSYKVLQDKVEILRGTCRKEWWKVPFVYLYVTCYASNWAGETRF